MAKTMQYLAINNPQQQSTGHRTGAFGYDRVRTSSLRFTRQTTPFSTERRGRRSLGAHWQSQTRAGLRPHVLPAWIQAIVTIVAALARPEVRNGLGLEALRAAFAGLVIFGGWLFLLCNLTFAVAYVAAWTVYGVVKHVDTKVNEPSRKQKVLALYEAA